jgi:hypothetical protein
LYFKINELKDQAAANEPQQSTATTILNKLSAMKRESMTKMNGDSGHGGSGGSHTSHGGSMDGTVAENNSPSLSSQFSSFLRKNSM